MWSGQFFHFWKFSDSTLILVKVRSRKVSNKNKGSVKDCMLVSSFGSWKMSATNDHFDDDHILNEQMQFAHSYLTKKGKKNFWTIFWHIFAILESAHFVKSSTWCETFLFGDGDKICQLGLINNTLLSIMHVWDFVSI